METVYKYDVAFSFCAENEQSAFALFNLLKERLDVFIYSEEQKRLAGRNGDDQFQSVFEKESRVVVIFYNENWGKTKWTKIEETAIRNKGYEEGCDFVILIPMDKTDNPPWLPKSRLWIGWDRWGIEGAASVVEAKVIEFEGVIKQETIEEKATRLSEETKSLKERNLFLNERGAEHAYDSFNNGILPTVEFKIKSIQEATTDLKFKLRQHSTDRYSVLCYGFSLLFIFNHGVGSSANDCNLRIVLFEGMLDDRGHEDPINTPKDLIDQRYTYFVTLLKEHGWVHQGSEEGFMDSQKLVEYWFDKLIERVYAYKKSKS